MRDSQSLSRCRYYADRFVIYQMRVKIVFCNKCRDVLRDAERCEEVHHSVRSKKSQNIELFLSYRPPYHWPYVRDFLAGRAVADMERVTDSSYQRWFEFEGVEGQFCATHNTRRGGFEVTVSLSDLTPLYGVIENIKAMLDLHVTTRGAAT